MANFSDKNYYELLELNASASIDQIQRAYEHAKKTFSEDSLAAYSLFSEEDRKQLLDKIENAYRILMNDSARRRYDEEMALSRDLNSTPPPTRFPESLPPINDLPDPLTGKALRNIRERLGISLPYIASRTRIHQPYLEFLEGDLYDKLPYGIYLRSYISQYAKMLGLDANKVVKGYLKNCPARAGED